jgi:hypothetical protein
MAEFTDTSPIGPPEGQTADEGWVCTEVQYGPGYRQGQTKVDGGYVTLTGSESASVEILEVREITSSDQFADPGWGMHYRRNPGGTELVYAAVTVQYTP